MDTIHIIHRIHTVLIIPHTQTILHIHTMAVLIMVIAITHIVVDTDTDTGMEVDMGTDMAAVMETMEAMETIWADGMGELLLVGNI